MRCGSVSVGLGPGHQSGNNPLVDAIEVYAVEKKRVFNLVPRLLESDQATKCPQDEIASEVSASARALALKTQILSLLYQLIGANLDHETPEGLSLKHLIRSTALSEDKSVRENVAELLERVEKNAVTRQRFLDEGTLLGISTALQDATKVLRRARHDELEEKHVGKKLKQILEASLKPAIAIALSRPNNYVCAMDMLTSEGLSPSSVALEASEILLYSTKAGTTYLQLIEDIIHLILAEMSIGQPHTSSAKANFATYSVISKILTLENQVVIERCCEAVRSFVTTHNPASGISVGDRFVASYGDVVAPIAYQCDSCSKFPITDARYTILEDDHDIDLCTKCYQVAKEYAEGLFFRPDSPVIINGRSIGGDTKLSCGQIRQMESVPIVNGTEIVEQVEQALQEAISAGPRSPDTEDSLRRAIQRAEPGKTTSQDRIVIDFDSFTESLFDYSVGLVGYMLDSSSAGVPIGRLNPLLSLVLDSITMGANKAAHISRGKRYTQEVLNHIRRMLSTIRSGQRAEKTRFVLLINFLRSLARLTGAQSDAPSAVSCDASELGVPSPDKLKLKTDPRFICDVHHILAVRRRCSIGANKNKRFYVCGMDRKERCKYFKWADEASAQVVERSEQQSRLEKELELFVWQLLSDPSGSQGTSLSDQLCDLMEKEFSRSDNGKRHGICPTEVKSSGDQVIRNDAVDKSSLYTQEDALCDFHDGVFCSKERIHGVAPLWTCNGDLLSLPRELLLPDDEMDDQNLSDKFIEASLDLISTVASSTSSGELQLPGHQRWFSLLSEVISASPASRFRSQAKKALKGMCGGNRALYHCVGDHYVFGFQFKEILHHSKSALDGALCVREMARQSGEEWHDDEVSWQGLTAGDLLGTLDLVSEECLTAANSKRIGAILDELLSVSKIRVDNWKNFCGLLSMPTNYRHRSDVSTLG